MLIIRLNWRDSLVGSTFIRLFLLIRGVSYSDNYAVIFTYRFSAVFVVKSVILDCPNYFVVINVGGKPQRLKGGKAGGVSF